MHEDVGGESSLVWNEIHRIGLKGDHLAVVADGGQETEVHARPAGASDQPWFGEGPRPVAPTTAWLCLQPKSHISIGLPNALFSGLL